MESKKVISYCLVFVFVCSCFTTVGIMGIEPFPTISNIHHTPMTPKSTDYVTVLADISHNESLSYVTVQYLGEDDNEWNIVKMQNYFGKTWYAHITPHEDNSTVIYKIVASTINDYTQTSMNYSYTIRDHHVPTIYGVERDPYVPKYDEIVNITSRVFDISGIQSVFLKYKFDENDTTQVPMTYDSNSSTYLTSIPCTDVVGTHVQYWVEATNNQSISEISNTYYYYTVGLAPYLADIWTEPFNATEGVPLTFNVELFARCLIVEGFVYYKINSGSTQSLTLSKTDLVKWTSEPLNGSELSGGDTVEYWCQFNYSAGESYSLYPSSPVHYFKTVVEYNPPEIDGIAILPSTIRKGDNVDINVTISDQSLTYVTCKWIVPGITNETHQSMTKIQGTNIYTTTIITTDLPENVSVVITIEAVDEHGNGKAILYSGFFINDGSSPVLFGIIDLENEPICYTYEHTLYVYVNDTSEIDWVKLHVWTNNHSQAYGTFDMIKGGEHLYYYSLDNSPFDISSSTWISYKFEAQDIHGYNTLSDMFKFFVWDYTGPSFDDFYIDSNIGYLEHPIIKTQVDDGEGCGVQSVSMVYSDDDWISNYTIQMNNQGDGWWKAVTVPTLYLNTIRKYYFASVDLNNNPSQSFAFNYSTIDNYNPHIITSRINDGEPIYDNYTLASEVHWEVWLEDPSGINTNNINLTFYSSFDEEYYTYSLTYDSVEEKFETTITEYNWIGDDWITYHYETEDLLENKGNTITNGFSVIDTEEPTISSYISSSGTAWLNSENTAHDSGCAYYNADVWKLKLQGDWDVAVSIIDAGVILETRFYYTIEGGTWDNYILLTYDEGIDKYKGTISSSTLISLYEAYYGSSYYPHLQHEIVFVKVWAIDNASQEGEYDYWNQDSECYEMFDYDSPDIDAYNIPSEKDHGTSITITIDASDLKGIQPDAYDGVQIRFRNGGNTYGYFTMEKTAGDKYDGSWLYIWPIPTSVYGTVNVDFKLKDYDGDNNWDCVFDTNPQTTTDETQTFFVNDITDPIITDWDYSPDNPKTDDTIWFHTYVSDIGSGIHSVWVEWWKNDVKRTNLIMTEGATAGFYASDYIGAFAYGTEIKYEIHAKDNANNEVWTSLDSFTIDEIISPTISSIYHSPNPFDEADNYLYVYATVNDEGGSGVDYDNVLCGYEVDDTWQGYSYMTHQGNNVFRLTINIASWDYNTKFEYKIRAYDNANNVKNAPTSGLYGPYYLQDAYNPSISNVHKHPSTVYFGDNVKAHATVTDSGSGLLWVRCYYKFTTASSWSYKTMSHIGSNVYEATNLPSSPAYKTVQYYVKAKDNSLKTKTSSTKTYYINFAWGQPTLEDKTVTVDLLNDKDEAYLEISKNIFSQFPSRVLNYVILEYKSVGEPSWHRVVVQETETYYQAYICSSCSLTLDYRLIAYVGFHNKPYYTGIETVELVDLTSPTIEVFYTPEIPEQGDTIFFYIEVSDSSGIKEVKCLYTSSGFLQTEEIVKKTDIGFTYTHVLKETIRFMFRVTDMNENSKQTNYYEFLVFPLFEGKTDSFVNNSLKKALFSLGGVIALLGVLTPTAIIRKIRRNRK